MNHEVKQTLEAFGIKKSDTTPYHPEGDGMVEQFNRSLLQLLRTERGVGKVITLSPFCIQNCCALLDWHDALMLMYGREPSSDFCTPPMGHEVNEFQTVLQSKLVKL